MRDEKLQQQAEEILRLAEQSGTQNNFYFVTTYQRYITLIDVIDDLADSLKDEGLTVKKEYIKGKKNVYSNPALASFIKANDSANKTVATLMRIMKNFGADGKAEEIDPLMSIINGGDLDDRE